MMPVLPSSVLRWLVASIATAVFLGPGAIRALALDFQLHTVSINEDGYMHKHACFKYDERTDVMIDLPVGWSTTSDAGSITSVPPDSANTLISLQRSALTPDTPFRDSGLDTYRRRALATVPAGAVNVRLVKETANPLPVFGWQDYEFEMTYEFFGASFHRSALFIDLNPQQQILTSIVAEAPAFDKVHAAAMDVMRSWCPTPPGN